MRKCVLASGMIPVMPPSMFDDDGITGRLTAYSQDRANTAPTPSTLQSASNREIHHGLDDPLP